MNRDNGFGDAFARDVLNIMNSKEHKELFRKNAQLSNLSDMGADEYDPTKNWEHNPSMGTPKGVEGPTMEDRGGPPESVGIGTGGTLVFPDPGVSDQAADMAVLKAKGEQLMADPALMENPELLDVANKAAMEQPLTPAEKELLLSASKKVNMKKEGLDVDLGVGDKAKKRELPKHDPSKDSPKGVEGVTMEERSKANKEKKSNVIDTLVVIADYLGEQGFTVSENLADRLIKSVIVEASKDECKCEKCKCDPCECDKKKEDKE